MFNDPSAARTRPGSRGVPLRAVRYGPSMTEETVVQRFDRIYGAPEPRIILEIWTEAFGEEYPRDLATYSFLRWSELRRLRDGLAVAEGRTFADIGCGRGGPGSWVARETGASLVGLDPSPNAVEVARGRAALFGIEGRAHFRTGSFEDAGIETASLEGAMSVDVLQLTPDRRAAFAEVARILRPGGRFCFTTWDVIPGAPSERLRPGRERIEDNRPLLGDAGFEVLSYEEPRGWRECAMRGFDEIMRRRDEVVEELGDEGGSIVEDARANRDQMPHLRRVLAVSRRLP